MFISINRSYSEIYKVMSDKLSEIAAIPDNKDWGIFFGWDPELISDLPTLSANFLDTTFSSSIPIVVVGQSGHVAWVNHPALELSKVSTRTTVLYTLTVLAAQ